jgi:hypothetical protein
MELRNPATTLKWLFLNNALVVDEEWPGLMPANGLPSEILLVS